MALPVLVLLLGAVALLWPDHAGAPVIAPGQGPRSSGPAVSARVTSEPAPRAHAATGVEERADAPEDGGRGEGEPEPSTPEPSPARPRVDAVAIVRGVVRDANTGAPVEGAFVAWEPEVVKGGASRDDARTDPRGGFSIERRDDTDRRLFVFEPRRGLLGEGRVGLEATVELEVTPAAWLEVRVGPPGDSVGVVRVDEGSVEVWEHTRREAWRIALWPGAWRVRTGSGAEAAVQLEAGRSVRIDLPGETTTPTRRVRGQVLGLDPDEVRWGRVHFLVSLQDDRSEYSAELEADGRFEGQVPVGEVFPMVSTSRRSSLLEGADASSAWSLRAPETSLVRLDGARAPGLRTQGDQVIPVAARARLESRDTSEVDGAVVVHVEPGDYVVFDPVHELILARFRAPTAGAVECADRSGSFRLRLRIPGARAGTWVRGSLTVLPADLAANPALGKSRGTSFYAADGEVVELPIGLPGRYVLRGESWVGPIGPVEMDLAPGCELELTLGRP